MPSELRLAASHGMSISACLIEISRTKLSTVVKTIVAITKTPARRWIAARKIASVNFDFSISRLPGTRR
jgi:hypothetical protein